MARASCPSYGGAQAAESRGRALGRGGQRGGEARPAVASGGHRLCPAYSRRRCVASVAHLYCRPSAINTAVGPGAGVDGGPLELRRRQTRAASAQTRRRRLLERRPKSSSSFDEPSTREQDPMCASSDTAALRVSRSRFTSRTGWSALYVNACRCFESSSRTVTATSGAFSFTRSHSMATPAIGVRVATLARRRRDWWRLFLWLRHRPPRRHTRALAVGQCRDGASGGSGAHPAATS